MTGSEPGGRLITSDVQFSARVETLLAGTAALEQAYLSGTLAAVISDPELLDAAGRNVHRVYEDHCARPRLRQQPFRLAAIDALTKRVRAFAGEPRRVFSAVVTSRGRTPLAEDGEGPEVHEDFVPFAHSIRADDGGNGVYLRADQILSARRWGIGFGISDDADAASLRSMLFHAVELEVSSTLYSLRKLEEVALRDRTGRTILLDPGGPGEMFEWLMLDVLNESQPQARHANLYEDVVQKTDLRFRTKGLDRRKGARIQVTTITDELRHTQKRALIVNEPEFVILSPRSLAIAIAAPRQDLVTPEEAQQLRSLDPTGSVDRLANCLAGVARKAFLSAVAHPLGPVAALPEALRRLIRNYVTREAFASTESVRSREATGETTPYGKHVRVKARALAAGVDGEAPVYPTRTFWSLSSDCGVNKASLATILQVSVEDLTRDWQRPLPEPEFWKYKAVVQQQKGQPAAPIVVEPFSAPTPSDETRVGIAEPSALSPRQAAVPK